MSLRLSFLRVNEDDRNTSDNSAIYICYQTARNESSTAHALVLILAPDGQRCSEDFKLVHSRTTQREETCVRETFAQRF